MLKYIILFCYLSLSFSAFSYQKYNPESLPGGLKFFGNNQPINKRTSYNVFHEKTIEFKDYFDIEFDLSLYSDMLIGYILRVKNRETNKVYNLFYDGNGNNLVFRFNEEGRACLITAVVSKNEFLNTHWLKMKISFNLKNNTIKLSANNQTFGIENTDLPDKYYPTIVFGKSDHIIDVPSFAIKDLSVGNARKYHFSLRENKGNIVHDKKGKDIGRVSNPEWLINDAYHWKFKASFKSATVAGANYNPFKNEVYYFNRDSILIYNVRSGEITNRAFEEKCPVELILGTNFIDTIHSKLYAYEVYYESLYDGTTVANLDLDNYQWEAESRNHLPTQLHHHGSYYDPEKEQYTIFGGFGNMHYSNHFYSYNLNQQNWQVPNDFNGDFIPPRYFSSIGHSKDSNTLYIFGGMGNESGQQILGRKYYYDLYKVDLNTRHVKKLWEIPWDKENVVPVRRMVTMGDSSFYTLCYPEHFTESYLKLYKFSLKDGSYKILGDSIPIYSDKISTNANLYYDNEHLYTVIQESKDDISSNLKVYSLLFPPITARELEHLPDNQSNISVKIMTLLILLLSVFGVIYLLIKKPKFKQSNTQTALKKSQQAGGSKKKKETPNTIFLFGEFTVRDRNNKDITYMFSSKLKQILCIILQFSSEDGITSQRLSDLLWPGKPAAKVKNSRGVTLNNLRKTLDELDGIEVIYNHGYFKIVQTEKFYCDYTRCMQIISSENIEEYTKELIEILKRGAFLKYSDESLFDSLKDKIEVKLEPVLSVQMEKGFAAGAYHTTIDLAKALFDIDPLNEKALTFQIKAMQKLKMNEEARLRYECFATEYKKVMGSDYPNPLKSFIKSPLTFIS
jgi:two-component SAPR family response regulator